MVRRDCLQSSPPNIVHPITVKRLQQNIDDTVDWNELETTCQWNTTKSTVIVIK